MADRSEEVIDLGAHEFVRMYRDPDTDLASEYECRLCGARVLGYELEDDGEWSVRAGRQCPEVSLHITEGDPDDSISRRIDAELDHREHAQDSADRERDRIEFARAEGHADARDRRAAEAAHGDQREDQGGARRVGDGRAAAPRHEASHAQRIKRAAVHGLIVGLVVALAWEWLR